MPLPLEPYLFPDDLFGGTAPTADASRCWWALPTRPRAEMALARNCLIRLWALYRRRCRSDWWQKSFAMMIRPHSR
jgi:hypothetical protein